MVGFFGVLLGLGVLGATFVAYFITSVDAQGQWYDGFGRGLAESPFLVRIFFGQDRMWAGAGWFVFDMAAFWGGLAVAFFLGSWGLGDRESDRP